ncbi:SET domain-containing protein [Xylariaceae sp. FL0804]|nr:SET domain-containing protein [Xylariaceae sp. FL0804]
MLSPTALAPTSPSSVPRALSSESSDLAAADSFSHLASLTSTPPTTVADSMSLASDTPKHDNGHAIGPVDEPVEPVTADEAPEVADSIVIATTTTTTTTTTITTTAANATVAADTDAADVALITPTEPTRLAHQLTSKSAPSTVGVQRSRRQRISAPVYNLARLAGTAGHGKRRSKGDIVSVRKRRTSVSGAVVSDDASPNSHDQPAQESIHASNAPTSSRPPKSPSTKTAKAAKKDDEAPRRIATRASGVEAATLAEKISTLGKRGRKTFERGMSKMSRELRRLQDTNEFAGIETKPVLYTTWANGKYIDPDAPEEEEEDEEEKEEPEEEPPAKRAKVAAEPQAPVDEAPVARQRRVKKWLDRGLYAGQQAPTDMFKGLTASEKKKLAQLPELVPCEKPNSALPLPIFGGLRMLIEGRDFKMPFDVCNPLPPGQPKPDEWRKMTKNRFVGDAAAYWKKTPHFKDYQSKCVCTPEDGCGESCQNRIMLYECDATNCNVGDGLCQNRAFARLQERTKLGGKFRIGVEVLKTSDRGYGIRANRPFEANQIIMEYTGEIITEEECDRRMNEKYKDNQCYYLMSFDQNMIIDATTGSIARFVNHSCQPNCRMVKWIVSGQPRMALFAGDKDIMTGDELTYDYNFDPFSAKNVQKCLCGSPNCRGVLGPKPKEVKPPKPSKEEVTKTIKKTKKVTKRKLKEVDGDEDQTEGSATKKRKIKALSGIKAKSVKRVLSGTTIKAAKGAAKGTARGVAKGAAKGAAKVIKRSVSTISVKAKTAKPAGRKTATVRKSKTTVKAYPKAKGQTKPSATSRATPKKGAARKSGLTIVAAGAAEVKPGEWSPPSSPDDGEAVTPSKPSTSRKSTASPRKAAELPRPVKRIKLVNSPPTSA